jgi:glycosyltransferase involved in cell wall biosynthesis
MVSVIIPTFNRSAYVMEAVASVLAQTRPPMELIVVDDGSEDDTLVALERFGTSSVRVLSQTHSGVSAARNTGIRNASGEWLAFLDSDDLWKPRKLASQLHFLSTHPHLKICQTEEIWIRNGRHLNPSKCHQKPEGYCFERLLDRCLVSPSAVMIHRALFEEIGLFDESLPACEDYDLWLRIGCRHPVGLLKEPLIIKRGGHADQLSATVEALDRYRIHALSKLLGTAPLSAEQRAQAMEMLEHKSRIYAQGCRKRGRFEEAESILALACS